MHGCQVGAANSGEHELTKKKSYLFFKIHRTSDIHMHFFGPSNRAYGFYGTSISHDSIFEVNKSAWMATGAEKSQEQFSPEKRSRFFLKFHEPVAPLWVLWLSQTNHMVFTEFLLARAKIARSIKVLGWQTGSKNAGAGFSEKEFLIF